MAYCIVMCYLQCLGYNTQSFLAFSCFHIRLSEYDKITATCKWHPMNALSVQPLEYLYNALFYSPLLYQNPAQSGHPSSPKLYKSVLPHQAYHGFEPLFGTCCLSAIYMEVGIVLQGKNETIEMRQPLG